MGERAEGHHAICAEQGTEHDRCVSPHGLTDGDDLCHAHRANELSQDTGGFINVRTEAGNSSVIPSVEAVSHEEMVELGVIVGLELFDAAKEIENGWFHPVYEAKADDERTAGVNAIDQATDFGILLSGSERGVGQLWQVSKRSGIERDSLHERHP